jgi:hypothetical protein
MRSFIRTHPITAFLVIACVLVGAGFTLPLLPEDGLGVIPVDLPGVGPSIVVAALALSIQCDGPSSPSSLALNRACAPLYGKRYERSSSMPIPPEQKKMLWLPPLSVFLELLSAGGMSPQPQLAAEAEP